MITAERLRELLAYDADTGAFTWRSHSSSRTPAGSSAGSITRTNTGHTYLRITVDRERHHAHRLAWLYVHGQWPSATIDHINGNGMDNRLSNLRLADHSQNAFNTRLRRNNTSGVKGVSFNNDRQQWRAEITAYGHTTVLGMFDSFEAAVAARTAAERNMHGAFARAA